MKSYKTATRLFLVLIIILSLVSFASAESNDASTTTITLSETDLVVIKGKPVTLKATVQPNANKGLRLEWESTDESIATVKNGRIEGRLNGECDIICRTAGNSGISAVCHVEVKTEVKKLSISDKKAKLLVGSTDEAAMIQLTCTIAPEDASWQDVNWSSSNESVATVSSDGIVRGISKGQATIMVSSSQPGSKAKAQIQVIVDQAVEEIQLETDALNLLAKKNTAVKANISPKNASNKKIEWISEDESIATVNANGQIKGLDAGTTTIIAKATDGSGCEARLSIRVVKPVLQIAIDRDKYDYGKKVKLTAKITNPDGSVDGLSELFPEAKMSATFQTAKGQKVKGFIVQSRTALEWETRFSLADDNMKAGDYRIEVKTNVENLKGVSDTFHYTADKSWLPPLPDCTIELQLSTTVMNLNEPLIMTATVTDTEGVPVPGVKVGFEVLTTKRTASHFFPGYAWLRGITDDDGKTSIRVTLDENEAKGVATGTLIVRAYIIEAAGSDEKTFEFTGKYPDTSH